MKFLPVFSVLMVTWRRRTRLKPSKMVATQNHLWPKPWELLLEIAQKNTESEKEKITTESSSYNKPH